jgi:hypothetical protein
MSQARKGRAQSMAGTRGRRLAIATLATLSAIGVAPAAAQAHGPIAPIASDYLAKPGPVPVGLEAKTVDGDQRMWLRVAPAETVVVLDYRGAPYLRFSRSGVDVNHNSEMYYLNQSPVAQTPPASLTAAAPPRWQGVSGGHEYGWHDGRLHALATVALSPGAAFVGRWSIPVLIDGRTSSIAGALWHADTPWIVWFWPALVLLACVLAAWRVRNAQLDAHLARVLALVALAAIAAGAASRHLHGRPTVGAFAVVELAAIVALVAWGLRRVLLGRAGCFTHFAIAFAAIAEGLELVPVLLHGFVLVAVPAFAARSLAVLCLGTGIALLPLAFRMAAQADAASPPASPSDLEAEQEVDGAWDPA